MIKFLTKEELQIITDALLFSSCCDISADFDDADFKRMVDIAEKLKSNPSKRVKLYVGGVYEDQELAERIGKNFLITHEK